MSIVQITSQFRKEDKHTSQTVTLEGVRFRIDTYTNTADGCWYMDLYDSDNAPLVIGIRLTTGLDLLFPYRYKAVPPGILFINDHVGQRQDPTLDAFDDQEVALYYQTSDEAFPA